MKKKAGSTIAINPLAVSTTAPMKVEIKNQPRCLDATELAHYAKATGKSVVMLKELARRAATGAFLGNIGAARMGHSMLVDGEEHIASILKDCDDMMAQYSNSPDMAAVVLKTRLGLAELWVKMAQAHIDSGRKAALESPQEEPQNKPPPPLMPVQINNYHNTVPSNKPMPYIEEDKNEKA